MKTYTATYDGQDIATVEIDHEIADENIRSMVHFWSGDDDRLRYANGDYTVAWMRQLAEFIIRHSRFPGGDEGWVNLLTGEYGITITEWNEWSFEEVDIEVNENHPA
jgi:hypothetical protein